MAKSFKITKDDGKTWKFDIKGNVTEDDTSVGVWNTDENNNLVVYQTTATMTLPIDFSSLGAPIATLPVKWKFNTKNQLCIKNTDGTQLINFHKTGGTPFYATRDAVLQVRPLMGFAFGFELRGEWDITDSHDLSFTVGTEVSIIDGFVQDSRSRFMYHFFDQQNIAINSVLGFVGQWQSKVVDGVPMLDFSYKRADGTTDVFSLPGSMTIDRGTNQFLYQYDKDDQTFQIQLLGFLEVSDNFHITYTLDQQMSRAGEEQVASTTFTLQARYSNQKFSGELNLQLTRDDGTGGTELTLGGQMTAVIGRTQLRVGFSYSQMRDGDSVQSTFGFNGTLTWDGGRVDWNFEHNAENTTLSISAQDIRLGSARADARLNLVSSDGRIQSVRFLFGINF